MSTQLAGRNSQVVINTANPYRDGTGSISNLISGASTYGTLIQEIVIEAEAQTSTGMVRIFIDPTGGGTYKLFREVNIWPVIPSGELQSFSAVVIMDVILAPNAALGVSTENSDIFVVTAMGQDIIGYT